MVLAASLAALAVATFMLAGWGWAFRRVLRLEQGVLPETIALGLGAVVFLGGVLNLARLAYPSALAIVVVMGLICCVAELREMTRPPIAISVLIAAIAIFTIATQLPPGIYNFRDDFQKYFAYPIRMLETGTVFGSPLSAMGMQTLGAQAFLDGFVVAFFPMRYINGVDAVFGLFLCLILAARFTGERVATLIGIASVVAIDPQYVNISTLYCGSALIMAIAAASQPAVVGLLYAALIALKPTFAVFIAIHLLAMVFAQGLRWAVRTGIGAALFLSPWVLLHAPHYLTGLRAHLPEPPPTAGEMAVDSIHLFSFQALDYGGSAAGYTLLVLAMGVCGLLCFRASRAMAAYCAAGVAAFVVFIYVLGPLHAGYDHSLRYYTPIAIGLAPAVFAWTVHCSRSRPWLPVAIAVLSLSPFAPSLWARMERAIHTHSASSYEWLARDPAYVDYNRRVLSAEEKRAVEVLQARVPEGETILAWVNAPFYLNYARNRIVDIDPAGVGSPWAVMPKARYLIWDYKGYATRELEYYQEWAVDVGASERRNARVALGFISGLEEMVRRGEVLYDNGEIRVVRLY